MAQVECSQRAQQRWLCHSRASKGVDTDFHALSASKHLNGQNSGQNVVGQIQDRTWLQLWSCGAGVTACVITLSCASWLSKVAAAQSSKHGVHEHAV